MNHSSDTTENTYRLVVSGSDRNYEFDPSYMQRQIREKSRAKAKARGTILGILLGILVTAAIIFMHRTELQKEVDLKLSESVTAYTAEVYKRAYANATDTDRSHELLKEALDDGDCTTAVICPCCDTVLVEAKAEHTPEEDDGDCTTAVTCQHCDHIMTPAQKSHTTEDDGNCLTEVVCSVCNTVTLPAKNEHLSVDDGDCTTDIICSNEGCTALLTTGYPAHSPMSDDGDCTTAVKCQWCGVETTLAKDAHTPEEDDGNCETAIYCSVCGTVTTDAKIHTPKDDDGDCTTEVGCKNKNCDQVLIHARDSHTANDDGLYTTAIKCSECETELAPAVISEDEYLKVIGFAALCGIVVAIIIRVIAIACGKSRGNARAKRYGKHKQKTEAEGYEYFASIRDSLLKNRARLVCESSSTTLADENTSATLGTPQKRDGRLFLTDQTLEFYSNDFENNYNNFAIALNAVQEITVGGGERNNAFSLKSSVGQYEFTVPDGSANAWRSQIVSACNQVKSAARPAASSAATGRTIQIITQ